MASCISKAEDKHSWEPLAGGELTSLKGEMYIGKDLGTWGSGRWKSRSLEMEGHGPPINVLFHPKKAKRCRCNLAILLMVANFGISSSNHQFSGSYVRFQGGVQGKNLGTSAICDLLGWWQHDPLKGESWPLGDEVWSLWITLNLCSVSSGIG